MRNTFLQIDELISATLLSKEEVGETDHIGRIDKLGHLTPTTPIVWSLFHTLDKTGRCFIPVIQTHQHYTTKVEEVWICFVGQFKDKGVEDWVQGETFFFRIEEMR
jgi:hypothetical protein